MQNLSVGLKRAKCFEGEEPESKGGLDRPTSSYCIFDFPDLEVIHSAHQPSSVSSHSSAPDRSSVLGDAPNATSLEYLIQLPYLQSMFSWQVRKWMEADSIRTSVMTEVGVENLKVRLASHVLGRS